MQLYHDAHAGYLLVHNSCEVTRLGDFQAILQRLDAEPTVSSRQVDDELAVILESLDVVTRVMGKAEHWSKGNGYRKINGLLTQLTHELEKLPVDSFLELWEIEKNRYATRIRTRAYGEGAPELLS